MSTSDDVPNTGLPTSPPKGRSGVSFLVAETKTMERQRREMEQQGHRQLAPVHAREHSEEQAHTNNPEDAPENDIPQHPYLEDRQDLDGIDPNLNPEPPLNTDARREFDNEKREQDQEKQLRLGLLNAPKFNPRPER
ncbi:MAG: hypothetical protein ACHP6H_06035 [Legionellales bacterium]